MFDGTYALLHLYVKAGRLVSVDLYSLKTNKNIETMTFAQLRRLISSSEASFINGWQYSFHFKRPNPPPSHIVDNRFAIPIRSGSEEYLVHIEP